MTKTLNGYAFVRPASVTKRERLLVLLKDGGTAAQLGEKLGLQKNATLRYIETAKREGIKIRISGWAPNSPGSPSPIYRLGSWPDTPKPAPMSDAEKKQRYRKDADAREAEAMAKRAKRLKPRRDPLTAALFGKA